MSINIGPITLVPGQPQQEQLSNLGAILAIKLTNGTPFDVSYGGFGVTGQSIIPAGTEYMLHAEDGNQGHLDLLAVNNVGATGAGVVNAVVFLIGETLPRGQWPVSVPAQTVSTSLGTTTSLTNKGNPSPTLVIDIGDLNFADLILIYNDGSCTWAVDQAGVKHQVITVSNSGNPLKLGQAGDITEVLGQLKVDQLSTFAGITDVGALNQTGGTVIITGSGQGSVHIGQVAQGDIIDTSGTIVFYKAPATIQFQIPSGTNVASIVGTTFACATINASTRLNLAQSGWDHLSQFSGTGNGTFGTGLSVVPSGIYTNCCSSSGSSQTWGATIATSSVVTTGASLAWFGQAIH